VGDERCRLAGGRESDDALHFLFIPVATQEGVMFLASIMRKYSFEIVCEDKPSKWGVPETKEGRYGG
jgi:hypothetical protein